MDAIATASGIIIFAVFAAATWADRISDRNSRRNS